MAKKRDSIKDAIKSLRREIEETVAQTSDPYFELHDIELEIAVVAVKETVGNVGVNWMVFSSGIDAKSSEQIHHKIKLRLRPLGDQSGGHTAVGSPKPVESHAVPKRQSSQRNIAADRNGARKNLRVSAKA